MQRENQSQWLLLLAVFIIATCGLIYELVAGTLASYLLGDSVTQFSTIIGVYLFAMGVGSFLSKYMEDNLLQWFIKIELLVGVIGGFSAALLFVVFPFAASFRIILYAIVFITGVLVGLEIPLLMRILKDRVAFKELVSRVFTFDYVGALIASLCFPLLLVPKLGLIRTALFFGILNIAVGLYLLVYFKKEIKQHFLLKVTAIFFLLAELVAFVLSEDIMKYSETAMFNDDIVYADSSPYQRIVITKNSREMRLYLNGNLQFSSADEYRYHEALVHPAMSSIANPEKVLVLGGGDGLAVREILKYPTVKKITLVDLDKKMTSLFTSQEALVKLNNHSLKNDKVKVVNDDAFSWLRSEKEKYNAVIVDFPDPSGYSIGKLYSTVFYQLLKKVLLKDALVVIQSTSPYVAPNSFWCIDTTLKTCGYFTKPYHNYVPSFGEWGYIIAGQAKDREWYTAIPTSLKYINPSIIESLFVFPADMRSNIPVVANRLNNQALVHYFEEEWGKYLE
jgi:spermidine synthase